MLKFGKAYFPVFTTIKENKDHRNLPPTWVIFLGELKEKLNFPIFSSQNKAGLWMLNTI